MKKYTHKINQYLLENFPTIWNTRIVWMLSISLFIHLIFYALGCVTLTDVELLHERNAKEIYFKNGVVFFNIILSTILIVIWLIYLFKNNAFKNFYPTSKVKLFSQFVSYLVIIFFATTFYYSYNAGLKSFINSAYPDDEIANEIEKVNNTAVFFPNPIQKYTLDNLTFPSPFDTLYCEKRIDLIDESLPFIHFLDTYQFYTLSKKTEISHDKNNITRQVNHKNYLYYDRNDTIITYYFKDKVVDVSSYLKTTAPSYYNFSTTFFVSDDFIDDYSYSEEIIGISRKEERLKNRNKQIYELLNRKDKAEIKQMLVDATSIFEKYHIAKNLDVNKWFELIYKPNNFEITSILRTKKRDKFESTYIDREQTEKEKFIKDHTTDFYIETDNLHTVYYNIEKIKKENYYEGSIHFFIWLTFILSVMIFIYRITSIKTVLLSLVTMGILAIFISLLIALRSFMFKGSSSNVEFFASYVSLIIGLLIFIIPIVFLKRIKKNIVAIFMNISIAIFPLILLLIVAIISMHQRVNCKELYGYSTSDNCFTLIESIGIYLSYILFILSIVFVYFYSSIIKKWKALPEG